MTDIIFHHYAASPVAEKIRIAFGIKNLTWHSVEQPRVPPRFELYALNGGYRRIPVMQIGADIYCDSQCILRELERRFPHPTLFPGGTGGLPYALSRWADVELFGLVRKLAFATASDELPAKLLEDRARLYLGPDQDFSSVAADLPHLKSQLRPQLDWLDQRLASGSDFLLGDEPAMPDLLAYYSVWLLRADWHEGASMLTEFSHLAAWEGRIKDIGHGTPLDMPMAEALTIGTNAQPQTAEAGDPHDSLGLPPGTTVTIASEPSGGDTPVTGVIRSINAQTISLHRIDLDAGLVCVHFPRVGYRITAT